MNEKIVDGINPPPSITRVKTLHKVKKEQKITSALLTETYCTCNIHCLMYVDSWSIYDGKLYSSFLSRLSPLLRDCCPPNGIL